MTFDSSGMDRAVEDARVELTGELETMTAVELVGWIMSWKNQAGYKRLVKMLAQEVQVLEARRARGAASNES
jgi:hypothetical protein